jgi:threonine dehydrogenase-like Zn-dependent dehydrogenase
MKALTVIPGQAGSAKVVDVPEPPPEQGAILARTVAIGVCGTDVEIVSGAYGWAPHGRERLILGHESLGEVIEAPSGSGFAKGDLVVGIVRRPDPVPCVSCGHGEWDMCRNGQYTERGIKELDGYCSERFRVEPEFAVKVDPTLGLLAVLMEPASVLAKAWDHIERIGRRAVWQPRQVLVTGGGPIGQLAALFAVQRGLELHVFDRNKTGPKPALVRELGGTYHLGDVNELKLEADIVVECTGAVPVISAVISRNAPGAVLCLAGVSAPGHEVSIDLGLLNRTMVLQNDIVFGSVNANRRHYELAAEALAKADKAWLGRLISRRVPLDRWAEALKRQRDDVKVVIDFAA